MTQGNIVNDMEKIIEFSSKTVVLSVNDIDTDQIIPARFLTVTTKDGLGDGLFADWRFDEDGNKVEQFPLNQDKSDGCSILISGSNFGCGSSREHAPWAQTQEWQCKLMMSYQHQMEILVINSH